MSPLTHQLFNFLSQLLKAKKGVKGHQKEIPFFLMRAVQVAVHWFS
jgi:hypothetical protein